jgi:uncharacterized membrane protein HdeD (DUF308 family)
MRPGKGSRKAHRYTKQEQRGFKMDSKIASGIQWWLGLRGVLAILFGLLAFFYTGQTLLALIYVFGVFAVLSGITSIVAAVRAGEAHMRWGWLTASGILSVAAGVAAFVWPGITALAFVYLVAAWAILTGTAEFVFALALPGTLAHPWIAGFSGLLSVVFGILLAVWPRSGVITLTWLLGIYAIANGITLLYYTFLLRSVRSGVRSLENLGDRYAKEAQG